MRRTTRMRGVILHGVCGVAAAAVLGTSVATLAQVAGQAPTEPQRQVYLVRQDASECSGSDVPNVNSPLVGGNVWVTRGADGNTGVKVAMTAKPDTVYHFFLKCVRALGDIKTDDEGTANVSFTFPTSLAGPVYSFDMYPEGAPLGNRYQSAQVSFQ